MPTDLHCLLVGAIDYWQDTVVKCERHGMAAGSVTEVKSHDKGKKGGTSVTGVLWSGKVVQNNQSVTEGMEKQVGMEV